MTTRRINADALIDLATEVLRAEVLPALGPQQRYAGAMIANAPMFEVFPWSVAMPSVV